MVADSRSARDGRYLEKIGSWDPMLPKGDEKRFTIDPERVQHWLRTGAQPTARVERLLAERGLLAKPAIPEQTRQHLPKAKAQERAAAKAAALNEAAEQAADESPAEATDETVEEAPADE